MYNGWIQGVLPVEIEGKSERMDFLSLFGAIRYHFKRNDEIYQDLHEVDNRCSRNVRSLLNTAKQSELSQWR